jgi:2-polyprenyl-3-methyl-5-hydroxy-6-metoxy-1,4-benzoquinol methylase
MNETAQDFWLENLGQSQHFNAWIADLIEPAVRGDVLEIGCGTGNFTGLLARHAASVTAADLNPEYVDAARRRWKDDDRLTFYCCDATKADWDSEFDTVVLLDVLEHVRDDVEFLCTLRHALRPQGALIVKVPWGEWLYGTLDQAIGHYRRYTKASLRGAFLSANLPDPDCFFVNLLGTFGWWLNARLLGRTTPPAVQVGLIERLVPLLRRVEGLTPVPFGLSLIAVSHVPKPVPQ